MTHTPPTGWKAVDPAYLARLEALVESQQRRITELTEALHPGIDASAHALVTAAAAMARAAEDLAAHGPDAIEDLNGTQVGATLADHLLGVVGDEDCPARLIAGLLIDPSN